MNFVVRGVGPSDLESLVNLAKQFTLLNLPADRRAIIQKIERSMASFAGELPKEKAEYAFVIEEVDNRAIAGSAQILAKNGTEEDPNYSFKVMKREHFSGALGIGFIHQILRLRMNKDGPSEVGGLVVDRAYRGRPEKVGKVISLNRFLYMGIHPERFEDEIHSELAPPLTDEGRSEFWEALGRRFTGLPYQEADMLSHQNKEFIRTLFPQGDIYLCLLDSKARLVLGRVGEETQPALYMLESLGFKYKDEVDPFDGGPHFGVKAKDVGLIKKGRYLQLESGAPKPFRGLGHIGIDRDGSYVGGASAYVVEKDRLYLPEPAWRAMNLESGEKVFFSPVS